MISLSSLPHLAICAALAVAPTAPLARAQSPTPAPAPAPVPRGEAELLVPPQGAAVDVPMHTGAVCILSFPERLAPKALTSSADFEIQPWGDDGIAVRAVNDKAAPSTVAISTATGQIKVNVTLRVVPSGEPALTLVRFKAVSAEEAFEVQVKDEIAKRMAPLERRLQAAQKNLEDLIARRANRQIGERILRRGDVVKLQAHARNGDHVILHVWRALILGEEGYLVFEIENRSGAPYRLAAVRVLADGRDMAGDAQLATGTPAAARDPALIGVVAAGASARGVVAIRAVQSVLRRPLALEISMPNGRGVVRVDRGLVLR